MIMFKTVDGRWSVRKPAAFIVFALYISVQLVHIDAIIYGENEKNKLPL